jgi:hypothetical protein
MASIRLEDEARTDPRFVILGKKLGTTRFDARGRTEELWAFCTEKQTYYLTETMIDTLAEFEGFAKLIVSDEIGLADIADKGIRIKGTRGRIEWLKKLRISSKKGGEKTRAKWQAKRLAKEKPKPEPKEGALSLVPVPALVLTNNINTEENTGALAPVESGIVPKKSKFNQATRQKMVLFIRAYAEAWKAKYNSNPEGLKDKALIGKVGHWIEGVSEQRALDLIQVYLQVDYRQINESCHDLWQFFRHLNRIGIALDSGQDTAGINWAKVFA